ncbi:MAG: aminoacyl-tRNA hydrolase [Thermodesulfobacteriota bacterium]
MWCVVGLGNPGRRYRWSRHNAGFHFIALLSQVSGIRLSHRLREVEWGKGLWCDEELALARPMTYMNLSGVGVYQLVRCLVCDLRSLLVVHDDLDLELGRIRFKQKGGDAGHKGLRSVIEALGDDRFMRLRIGIGRPPPGVGAEDYVLAALGEEERARFQEALSRGLEALRTLILEGIERAMNLYHGTSELKVREDKVSGE